MMADALGTYGGLRVYIMPDPHPAYWSRPPRPPTKRAGRRGTRRAWKRRHPPKFIQPVGSVEHGKALRTPDSIFMTARTWADLRLRLGERP